MERVAERERVSPAFVREEVAEANRPPTGSHDVESPSDDA